MVLSEDGDDGQIEARFESLCMDLNMDRSSQEEAWQSFERIRTSYTLEGDGLHWLACALYVSCRSSLVPTVHGRDMVEGNCVSLTSLLRKAKLSLIEFFKKMKKWADMASLPQKLRDKVERLERNFAVSTVTFKKFQPIFLDIFKNNPADDAVRHPKGRKHKRHTIATREVFSFCWTMFVQVKGNFPAISDDLVNSYHLLLCCIDWFYANALLSNRRDLLNPSFSGLPENFSSRDYKPPAEVPCIIKTLCEEHQGLHLEAKGIKEHWWKPYIRKLFDRKMLAGKAENLMGVLELTNFEKNTKSVNNAYDEYVLNGGDFDERVFLGDDANEEIGTPAKSNSSSLVGETSERSQVARNLWQHLNEKTLAPATPLTNRRYLTEKEGMVTPVSTATQSVSRLQTLLSGRKTCPNEFLLDCFSKCARNPKDGIVQRVVDMGNIFCEKYAQPCDSNVESSIVDFAKRRLQLAESLYYKALENILVDEKQRHIAKDNFLSLLEQDIFHRSLFAICLEIVIFSYNSQRVFPWIIDVFEIPAYYFYKVIEVLIRAEEGLSRDIVKHLNHVEETSLESLVWRSDSPVWEAVKQSGDVPSVEEVSLPSQLERDGTAVSNHLAALISPPLVHPALRRVATTDAGPVSKPDALQSPGTISATDRFSSPVAAKRRLFPSTAATDGATNTVTRANSLVSTSSPVSIPMALITAQDGRQILIPVQVKPSPIKRKLEETGDSNGSALPAKISNSQPPNRPKRTGSLALFFRKVYHLASVRLRDLCDRLEIDSELCSKIWTCFEHSLISHVDLMQDRHLDQMIMCAVYVICKVTEKDRSFQDIMKCYRLQPQAESHVYRSVLLGSRQRYESGGSNSGSRNDGNRSGSPAVVERKGRKERENNLSSIRSSSTLPISQPGSQPPTPTRIAGTANTFQFDDRGEDRGDLIKFYNTIYVNRIKNYALKFSTQNVKDGVDKPILSPLPVVRSHCSSPRKISSNHSLYVSPHKAGTPLVTPQTGLLYCFNRSPARDLRAINNMIRSRDNGSNAVAKRLPLADEGAAECPPTKRLMTTASPSGLTKRLEELMHDRQAHGSN